MTHPEECYCQDHDHCRDRDQSGGDSGFAVGGKLAAALADVFGAWELEVREFFFGDLD